jgi:AmiR/NasT family two-component response regulator
MRSLVVDTAAMDTSIRVLVANRPRLLRELVLSTLSEQAGIRVVGEAGNEQDLPSMVAKTRPDFLLIALDEPQKCPALCDLLLREFPGLRIIAMAPNSNVGVFYWSALEIHSAKVEASKQALLEAIRKKAAPGKGVLT